MDPRERVWADRRAGMATPAVARKYSVGASWVRRLERRHEATGSPAGRPPRTGRPVVSAPREARVPELVRDDPDARLKESRHELGVAVSTGPLFNYPRRLEPSLGKG